MTEAEYIEAAESRRRKRERELLLLLLLFTRRAIRTAITAYRHGLEYQRVIDNVLSGNLAIGMRGAMPGITAYLLSSHASGARLASQKTGYNYKVDATELRGEYQIMAAALVVAIADAIKREFFTGGSSGADMRQGIAGIRSELLTQGYEIDNPYALESGIERAVVTSFNNGILHVASGTPRTSGFKHISVMDDATTTICIDRNDLVLPVTHPYWQKNWPSLHWNCRSIIDIVPAQEWSDWLPTVSPMPGFGAMPVAFIDLLNSAG